MHVGDHCCVSQQLQDTEWVGNVQDYLRLAALREITHFYDEERAVNISRSARLASAPDP